MAKPPLAMPRAVVATVGDLGAMLAQATLGTLAAEVSVTSVGLLAT